MIILVGLVTSNLTTWKFSENILFKITYREDIINQTRRLVCYFF